MTLLFYRSVSRAFICGRRGPVLAATLGTNRPSDVAPEVNLQECETCFYQVWIRLPTLALKSRGDNTRSPKQGPTKRTYVFKKNFNNYFIFMQFFGKFLQNNSFAHRLGSWHLPLANPVSVNGQHCLNNTCCLGASIWNSVLIHCISLTLSTYSFGAAVLKHIRYCFKGRSFSSDFWQ